MISTCVQIIPIKVQLIGLNLLTNQVAPCDNYLNQPLRTVCVVRQIFTEVIILIEWLSLFWLKLRIHTQKIRQIHQKLLQAVSCLTRLTRLRKSLNELIRDDVECWKIVQKMTHVPPKSSQFCKWQKLAVFIFTRKVAQCLCSDFPCEKCIFFILSNISILLHIRKLFPKPSFEDTKCLPTGLFFYKHPAVH